MTDVQAKQRNKERKKKYSENEEYREATNSRNRDNYREKNGGVELRDCSTSLCNLDVLGTVREIVGTNDEILTFTAKETAEVLDGYSQQSVYRWLREGQLPEMTTIAIELVKAKTERRAEVKVYTESEMRIVVNVIAEHQKKLSYYTKKHTDTKEKLDKQMAILRG